MGLGYTNCTTVSVPGSHGEGQCPPHPGPVLQAKEEPGRGGSHQGGSMHTMNIIRIACFEKIKNQNNNTI